MKPRPTDKPGVNNWLLIKHRDQYASDDDVLKKDKSVASGRAMDQIKDGSGKAPKPFMLAAKETFKSDAVWQSKPRGEPRGAKPEPEPAAKKKSAAKKAAPAVRTKSRAVMPEFIEPQFSRSVTAAPNGANWAHEVKFDGYRMQLRVENGEAQMRTRKGLDSSEKFGAIVRTARALPDCIIDGEVCALDKKGTPSFPALQAALSNGDTDDLVYFAFDLMFADGDDIRKEPLSARKARLQVLLEDSDAPVMRYVEHLTARGDDVWKAACQADVEGIISKPLNAPYRSGDRSTWTKAKCRNGQEVVIGGWTETDGRFRSLLAGIYRDDEFVYVGRVGTGYNARNLPELTVKLKALKSDTRPFVGENAPRKERGMFWVEPELVAQIEFAGWSEDGIVRQSAFKGLRSDKPAREVMAEMPADAETELAAPKPKSATRASTTKAQARSGVVRSTGSERTEEVRGVAISKPDKALWPDAFDGEPVTKLELAEYLEAVGPWIIGYIKGRPCSIVRAPDGIEGKQRFFQRHGSKGQSELLSLVDVRGDKEPYLQIDSIEGLIAAGQSAALDPSMELHAGSGRSAGTTRVRSGSIGRSRLRCGDRSGEGNARSSRRAWAAELLQDDGR